MRSTRALALTTAAAIAALIVPATAAAERGVYATNAADGTVSAFDADAATGTLSPVPAATKPTGSDPRAVVLTPSGRSLYVADSGDGTISGYAVAADGSLSALPGSPYAAGPGASGLSATTDGRYLYAANDGAGTISGYAIGADGSLASVPGSPFASIPGAHGIASSPSAKLLYATSESGPVNLAGYAIGADGSLSPIGAALPAGGSQLEQPVFRPDGGVLYVADFAGRAVYAYAVAAGGALSPVAGSPFAVADGPYGSLAMAPDGGHLYVPAYNGAAIVSYPLAASSGALGAPDASAATGPTPTGSAVSPNGAFLYSSGLGRDPNVSGFAIGADASLAPVAGSPFASGGSGGDFASLAITPNQPPQAAFNVFPASPDVKERTTFQASASSDPDGKVATWLWDFGDGKTKIQDDPKVRHNYDEPGAYTVTLAVIDDEGCSVQVVYTGQTALCNGSAAKAVATQTVQVADRSVLKPTIRIDQVQGQTGKRIAVKVRAGAREEVVAVATGKVKIRGKKTQLALKKKKKDVKAKKVRQLRLVLRRQGANRKVFRALEHRRGKAVAKLRLKLTDAANNKLVLNPRVELK